MWIRLGPFRGIGNDAVGNKTCDDRPWGTLNFCNLPKVSFYVNPWGSHVGCDARGKLFWSYKWMRQTVLQADLLCRWVHLLNSQIIQFCSPKSRTLPSPTYRRLSSLPFLSRFHQQSHHFHHQIPQFSPTLSFRQLQSRSQQI